MPPPTRDLEVAGADRLVDQPGGADARRADLVDRLRGDLLGDPGLDLRLARGDLALAGLEHRCPSTTCWTCSGSTSARSSAASIAMPPSSVASRRGEAAAELADRACGRRTGSRCWACGSAPSGTVLEGRITSAVGLTCRRDATSAPPPTPRRRPTPTRSPSASSRARASRTTSTARCRRSSTPARPGARCGSSRSRTPAASAGCSSAWARATSSTPSAPAWPPRVGRRRARASSARARCAGSCPHHVDDARVAGAGRGHAARRLPLRRATRPRGDDDDPGGSSTLRRQRPRRRRRRPSDAAAVGGRGGQRRARPPEHARQRADADALAERARELADESRRLSVEVRGRERDRGGAAWAPSRRSRAAPTRSRR